MAEKSLDELAMEFAIIYTKPYGEKTYAEIEALKTRGNEIWDEMKTRAYEHEIKNLIGKAKDILRMVDTKI